MNVAPDTQSRNARVALKPIRLRVDVFDTAAAIKGAENNTTRARLIGTTRENFLRIRNGQTPSLELALHMAETLGVKVEDLFEAEAE